MNQTLAILRAKVWIAGHQISGVRHESRLKVAVISVSALALWLGAFAMLYWGFAWLVQFGGREGSEFNFGNLLMARMLGILTLAVFLMLGFSNILVAFSTLYRSDEVGYLIQSPVSMEQLFYARFAECLMFSSWSVGFLGSPLILAYGLSVNAPLIFYMAAVLFFVPFITIPACLGSMAAMFLVLVFPRLRVRSMVALGLSAVILFFVYISRIIRGTRIAEDTILPAFLDASSRTQSPFLPSFWTSQGILCTTRYDLSGSIFWFLMLLSTALMSLWVAGRLAHWMYYPGWTELRGQDRQRIRPMGKGILGRLDGIYMPVKDPYRALIIKDIKMFWRDPTQWGQFMVFFGIMAIYIANLRNTSRFYEQEMWRSFIACLNVGAVTLILSTLTSRFVFPLISLEGHRFWVLGLAPLSLRQLLLQKFWLSVCATSVFTVGLSVLSGYMLKLPPIYFALTVYSVIITNFGLAGLAVGLGAFYPNFDEDNSARIVSGMGGTLNLLLSVGYITLVVSAQTFILQWHVLSRFARPEFFWYALAGVLVFITALTVLVGRVPMRLGLRNLEKMEF